MVFLSELHRLQLSLRFWVCFFLHFSWFVCFICFVSAVPQRHLVVILVVATTAEMTWNVWKVLNKVLTFKLRVREWEWKEWDSPQHQLGTWDFFSFLFSFFFFLFSFKKKRTDATEHRQRIRTLGGGSFFLFFSCIITQQKHVFSFKVVPVWTLPDSGSEKKLNLNWKNKIQ